MTPPPFLVPSLPAGDRAELFGAEGRHAATVRRLGPGERVDLTDGVGALAECTVTDVVTGGLVLDVGRRRTVPRPDPLLVVVQGLPKGDRGVRAVELMTEIGADEMVPWAASRSIVRWQGSRGDKALERWRSTAREAAKQSRRAWLPGVAELHSTDEVCALLAAADTAVVLHESAGRALADVPVSDSGRIVMVIGPEGGPSEAELDAFAAAGGVAARLGPEVLRTSTAGVAALALLSSRLGRWS